MGACSVQKTLSGYDVNEVFAEITAAARELYGNDSYSGHIGLCDLTCCDKKFAGMCSKENMDVAKGIIDSALDKIGRNTCHYIDLGIVSYDVVKVKIEQTKTVTPKFELMYVVHEESTNKVLFRDKSKKVCEEKMLELGFTYDCILCKEYSLVSGSRFVAQTNKTVKSYNKKPKTIPKGAKLMEKHKYVFYGWAAE